jgi:hypothetical protein
MMDYYRDLAVGRDPMKLTEQANAAE